MLVLHLIFIKHCCLADKEMVLLVQTGALQKNHYVSLLVVLGLFIMKTQTQHVSQVHPFWIKQCLYFFTPQRPLCSASAVTVISPDILQYVSYGFQKHWLCSLEFHLERESRDLKVDVLLICVISNQHLNKKKCCMVTKCHMFYCVQDILLQFTNPAKARTL